MEGEADALFAPLPVNEFGQQRSHPEPDRLATPKHQGSYPINKKQKKNAFYFFLMFVSFFLFLLLSMDEEAAKEDEVDSPSPPPIEDPAARNFIEKNVALFVVGDFSYAPFARTFACCSSPSQRPPHRQHRRSGSVGCEPDIFPSRRRPSFSDILRRQPIRNKRASPRVSLSCVRRPIHYVLRTEHVGACDARWGRGEEGEL